MRLDNNGIFAPQNTSFNIIGPLLLLDLTEVPPLSVKTSRGWTMRQINFQSLKHMQYPFAEAADTGEQTDVGDQTAKGSKADLVESDASKGLGAWALSVSYFMPTGITLKPENIKVMWWDQDKNNWSAEGIDGIEYTEGYILNHK